jgi:hypothetical protein
MIKFTTTRLTLWALLLAMPLLFSSCKKDNDDVTPATVEGDWKITGIKANPAIEFPFFGKVSDIYQLFALADGDCLNNLVVTFSNGATSVNVPPACQDSQDETGEIALFLPLSNSSKWTLDGNKLTLTNTDGTVKTYDVTTSGNTMTWSSEEEVENLDGTKTNATLTVTWTRA